MDLEEVKILRILEFDKKYKTRDILKVCIHNEINISYGRLLRVLKKIELHSPWNEREYLKHRIYLFEYENHPTFIWVKKNKKEEIL